MSVDQQQVLIEALADAEQAALELACNAAANSGTWREIAIAAIHELHRLTNERDRLRRQLAALREQLRATRSSHPRAA